MMGHTPAEFWKLREHDCTVEIHYTESPHFCAAAYCGTIENARLVFAAPVTAAERDTLEAINAELLEALIQARTDYLRLDAAYEEAMIDLGVSMSRSRETARLVIARIDATIAKATGEAS